MNYFFNHIGICYSIAFLIFMPVGMPVDAQVGCMARGMQLKEKYDAKEYHFVSCNCPCRKSVAHKNKCLVCHHVHDTHSYVIINDDASHKYASKGKVALDHHPEKDIELLVRKYINKAGRLKK